MSRPSLRPIAVVALCVVLAGSGALSAEPRGKISSDFAVCEAGLPGFWDTVWSFLASVFTKNGAAGDPFGQPSSSQPSQPDSDNGSAGDPFGG
jgi:hypothetical protein